MVRRDDAQPARLRFDGEAKRVVVRRPRLGRDGWALFSRRAAAQSVTLSARELQALLEGRTVAVDVEGEFIVYLGVNAAALDAMRVFGALGGVSAGTGVGVPSIPQREDPGSRPTHEERVLAARIRTRFDKQQRRPRVRTPDWIVNLARGEIGR